MIWRRCLCSALIGPLLLITSITPAHAQNVAVPRSPDNPESRQLWHSSSARPDETDAQLSVEIINSSVVADASVAEGEEISFDIRLENTSTEEITDVTLTPQRADAAQSVAVARQQLAAPQSSFGYYAATEEVGTLQPGEQRDITVTVATDPGAESSFSIISPGVYPVLLAAMGTSSTDGAENILNTERTLISVGETEPNDDQPGLTLVYPITAEVDLVPGETGEAPDDPPLLLASDNLAQELATGGRLDQLLNSYEVHAPKDNTCIAVDPELISVIDRMSAGYTVTTSRELPERPQRLRDSWGSGDEDVDKQPGTGADDAGLWLERLTEIAATYCVMTLPWAQADLNAVAATHNQWLAREALERGPAVVEEILGTSGIENTVIAPAGWVSEEATAIAGWADHVSSSLPEEGMSTAFHNSESDQWMVEPAEEVRVLVADNTVWDDAPSRFHYLRDNVIGVGYDASLAATLMGSSEVSAIAGYSDPASRYDPSLDSLYSRSLTAAHALRLATLTSQEDILAMAPVAQSPEGARAFLSSASALLGSHAHGMTVEEYVEVGELGPVSEDVNFGAPYADPTVYTDTEITRASQQAYYTDGLTRILSNAANVALTPYGYTLPLRRDLLRSFGFAKRDGMRTFDTAVEDTNYTLATSGEMLAALRGSITLLPPGNVYTRTSESSPLLIVAENRLPLPVTARLAYENPQGGQLILPETVYIPASGSITVSMTADLPEDADQTHIRLWLATPEERPQAISSVVDITVQTRAATRDLLILSLGIVAVFVAIVIIRKRRS